MAQVSMTTEQKVKFTIAPSTQSGSAAEVENFTVDLQGADLTSTYDEATKTGEIISGSTAGTFTVIFKADAKIGPEEFFIEETHEVTISLPEATTLTGTFATPEPK